MSAATTTRPEHAATAPDATALDRLNPVSRLGLSVLVALPVLISLDWLSASIMLAGLLVVFRAAGVPLATMARRMIPVVVAALLAAVTMALYGKPGGTVHWHWWLVVITQRSLTMAGAVILRVLVLGLSAVVLLGGLDLTAMADGLAQVLRLPARFVLGALAGMRMLSLFLEDWRTLGQARRARGLGDTGRFRRWATMAFALLVFAIRRGTRLATAMEARGFDAEHARNRTWARPSRLGRADLAAAVIALALVVSSLAAAIVAGTFAPVTS
ncbi:energy-coupling factor transporter transmembrane component T family protein [Propionibacterium australiense]|uniref:Cobalt transport protein n=1 Tax=Propionibacterium australiense TaxID=119981 RepID=A0A383S5L7_9ACTN|nr:energy-coupling factor transporter transmembrane component T [Propionibacterium australiense]RLP09736.1 energy-coupling factor transporter transmembrane protein EcfT [Propionibacterium australiense]RLP10207.1 energy-coupling factor transporter transmembrane protein EcfT [Propionibacterium australiense]SYZ33207.1 Cobalt transport protein [Propionibacterium australiense]VEH89324.1 Putative HMP/thiamine permease protein YkoC [Propionibacterium australiense]